MTATTEQLHVSRDELVDALAAILAANEFITTVTSTAPADAIMGVHDRLSRRWFPDETAPAIPEGSDDEPWHRVPEQVESTARAAELVTQMLDEYVQERSERDHYVLIKQSLTFKAMAPRYREAGTINLPFLKELRS